MARPPDLVRHLEIEVSQAAGHAGGGTDSAGLRRSPLCLGDNPIERLAHRLLPGVGHPLAPETAQDPEVGPQFALPGQPGASIYNLEEERLHDMRYRAAKHAEIDALRALKANRLHRCGDTTFDRREVRSQNHIGAALPNLQLVLERAWRPPQVGPGDDVEDDLPSGRDWPAERSQTTHPSTDPDVDRDRATCQQSVSPATDYSNGQDEDQAPHPPSV